MGVVEIALVALALSTPAWQLLAPPLGLPRQKVAAFAAGFAIFAAVVLPPVVTPDWSWLSMLGIAVPCAIAAFISVIVLTRFAHASGRRPV